MDFVKICNVYIGKVIIKVAKRIFNSGKIRRSYSDLNFGVTFLEHSVNSCSLYKISRFSLRVSANIVYILLLIPMTSFNS